MTEQVEQNQVMRLAYTVPETAEMLGMHVCSVYRLIDRKLLKASGALRTLRIPHWEIERYLRETTV